MAPRTFTLETGVVRDEYQELASETSFLFKCSRTSALKYRTIIVECCAQGGMIYLLVYYLIFSSIQRLLLDFHLRGARNSI